MFDIQTIIYEDNHLLFVNKKAGDLVQGDSTGDPSLRDVLMDYIKVKYQKPGNVFLGVPHRLDRPTSGICMFCKTSKSLSRVQKAFANRKVDKTYWALIDFNKDIPSEGELIHYLAKNHRINKSFVVDANAKEGKKAILRFKKIAQNKQYVLLEIDLLTGRHHQIRVQLAEKKWPIVGDLKYGYAHANKDKSIALHARALQILHPVRKEHMQFIAPLPSLDIWDAFREI